jgi:ABC-2 type transport system permease protein
MGSWMLTRIWTLAAKELIQLWRDKMILLFVFFGPVTELALVAWATSGDIDHLPTAVVDRDHSPASRALVQALENTGTFDADYYLPEETQAQDLVDTGTVLVALFIPPDFEKTLTAAREPAQLQVVLDGADPSAARTAAGSAEQAIAAFAQEAALQRLGPMASQWGDVIELDVRVWFNEELKTSHYEVPSELGFMLVGVALMLASLGIARERELGTLEQLVVTPIKPSQIVIGKSVMAVSLGYTLFLLMLGMVVWLFDVPMRGSLPLLMILAFIYMLVELGWGLMISTVAHSQMQALLACFVVVMVMIIFSGYAFPVDTMPPFMQTIANIFPLKHWLIIFRAILLKGAGLKVIWRDFLAILVLGALIYAGTILLLRRTRLD